MSPSDAIPERSRRAFRNDVFVDDGSCTVFAELADLTFVKAEVEEAARAARRADRVFIVVVVRFFFFAQEISSVGSG